MKDYLMIAPLETLKKAVAENWPHIYIGRIALEAQEAGIDETVIANILSRLKKRK